MNLTKQNNIPRTSTNIEVVSVKKELNVYGKGTLLIGYTLCCLFLGAIFFHSESDHTKQLAQISEHYKDILQSLGQSKGLETINVIQSNKHLTSMIESKVLDSLENRETAQHRKIVEQQNEISKLKKSLLSHLDRKPASLQSNTEHIISYNKTNMKVFRYEQNLKKQEFKEKQEKDRNAFLNTINQKKSIDQDRFRKFLHKQKIEFYELEQKLIAERKLFKKKKFRVAS